MANYKELYLKMMHAAETAIHVLISAQQACEEQYLSEEEGKSDLLYLPSAKTTEKIEKPSKK